MNYFVIALTLLKVIFSQYQLICQNNCDHKLDQCSVPCSDAFDQCLKTCDPVDNNKNNCRSNCVGKRQECLPHQCKDDYAKCFEYCRHVNFLSVDSYLENCQSNCKNMINGCNGPKLLASKCFIDSILCFNNCEA